jgi:pimeloyl-ACP methyl ester carboxylesterase
VIHQQRRRSPLLPGRAVRAATRRLAGRSAALALIVALVATACGNGPYDSPGATINLHPSASASAVPSPASTPSASATGGPLGTPEPSASVAPSASASPSASVAPSASPSATPSPSASASTAPSASAAASAVGSPGSSPGTGTLNWADCGAPFECATLSVPVDYANPAAKQISLALIRLPASDQANRIGSLVTNPGGPGGSGIEFVRNSAEGLFSVDLRARFDIVGFDPRGVGASTPVECLNGPDLDRLNALDPTPDTPAERDALIAGAKEFDAACQKNSGDLLPFMTTVDVAKDLDQIRVALGESKLSYFGFSYGSFIGTEYAGLFPNNIRAMVLDGPIDPTLTLEQRDETQAVAFAKALANFLADCASRPTCAFYNQGNPSAAFDTLMKQIDQHPLPATTTGDPRPVGPGEAFIGVLASLYSRDSWQYLEQALYFAQNGDGSILLLLADSYNERSPDGTYTNSAAANNAVNCTDYVVPTDVATYDALATKLEKIAPRFGVAVAYSGLSCAYWPVHATKDPGEITADAAPPIVLVGSTGDPATPYSWALSLSKQLKSAVLVTRQGEGHTGYQASGCVRTSVDGYLISLQVPHANTVCTN